ncbi:4'-phosphopantetheinyl transferase superfamily [Thamnocephalis sphaerospora]|uniref:holo-[acyl-carrier-protein] synthase n=1 Tax=Thamnocephalis sphaerospora TaxID=78915 RepID=A0A4P9XQK5_9FUNG|nr:4'-phosphopantetheinyl transferase superfamily [Thamnocephalis sphaerospora]|eukprot:RKP07570.1 4'-phosphopantetheinyl transferase superfamily [Thamnocephalis sphaerospora]
MAKVVLDQWLFCTADWHLDEQQFNTLIALLPPDEVRHVLRFRRRHDQLRSLAGRLLARCWLAQHLRKAWSHIVIARGPDGKPRYQLDACDAEAKRQVDFNISHDGNWVAFVGALSVADLSTSLQIGVDVVETVETEDPEMLLASLRDQFSPAEWAGIHGSVNGVQDVVRRIQLASTR